MNAQLIIEECNTQRFNPKTFRQEINISFLIQDAVKEYRRQNE